MSPSLPLQARVGPDNGKPLIFLHGVLRNGKCFAPLLSTLGRRFQVHAVDFRGHGLSPAGDCYLVTGYVPDVIRYLSERIGRPSILYGHSLGAMVAAAVAAEAPDLVSAIVIEDPPFHTMGDRIHRTALLDYFKRIQPFASSAEPTATLARQLAELEVLAPDMASRVKLGTLRDPTALRFFASCLRQVRPPVLEPIVEGRWLDGYAMEQIAASIRCPVLLFQCDGARGGMLTDEDGRRFESLAADCTRVLLKGVSHQAHWMATDTVARHTLEFLVSLE